MKPNIKGSRYLFHGLLWLFITPHRHVLANNKAYCWRTGLGSGLPSYLGPIQGLLVSPFAQRMMNGHVRNFMDHLLN